MKRIVLIVTLISTLLLSGCKAYRDINIESVNLGKIQMKGTNSALVTVKAIVNNPAKRSISLTDFNAILLKDNSEFAIVTLMDKVSVPAKSREEVELQAEIQLVNPLALLTMGINITNWTSEDFKVTGRAVVRNGAGGRKIIKVKEIPLEKLVKKL